MRRMAARMPAAGWELMDRSSAARDLLDLEALVSRLVNGRLEAGHRGDPRPRRSHVELALEPVERVRRAGGDDLDGAVGQVAREAAQVEPAAGARHEPPEADPLHHARHAPPPRRRGHQACAPLAALRPRTNSITIGRIDRRMIATIT